MNLKKLKFLFFPDEISYISIELQQNGRYVRPDPNRTRLLLAPTARPLKSGQGYFSAYEIFFPLLAIGITDFISLSGGMSLFTGSRQQLVYFAPKITPIQTGKFSAASGLLYLNTTEGGEPAVIYYGVGTYGTDNLSITAGLGWGYYGSNVADKPTVLIGAELRASNSIKFITENWFLPNFNDDFLSFGFRFFGENLAADLGFIYPIGAEIEGFPFLPWFGFAYNFTMRKSASSK